MHEEVINEIWGIVEGKPSGDIVYMFATMINEILSQFDDEVKYQGYKMVIDTLNQTLVPKNETIH